MFRRLFSVVLVALATIPLWGANENTLTAESLVLPAGTTEAKLTVNLTNEAAISDIQFDLYLPTGFSVAYDEDDEACIEMNTTRTTAKRHSVDYLEKTGFTRIMCTSSKGYTFSGNSGPVVDIYLTIDASVAAETYNVDIKNIAVSNSENTYTPANTTSTITIEGSGGPSTNNNSLAAANLSFDSGMTEGVLSVELNNEAAISDIQFDLYLPTGFSVAYDEDDEARIEVNTTRTTAKRHSVDYLEKTGFTRIMCTSSKGYTFSGNSGPVVDIYIIKDANVSSGTYTVSLKNIAISNSEDTYTPADITSYLVVPAMYNIIYKVDGEIYKTETIAEGASITPIAAPAKEGYTFSGWYEVPTTMPNHDVTVIGTFTINQYTVTFKVDGEVFQTFTQNYDTTITVPEAPTKEGYTFSGWQNVASTVPAQDVTYEANFTINKYMLKFIADGQVVSETLVDFGSAINAPEAPAKEGHSFVNWGNVATTMPANDVTYTAQYSVNQYTVTFKIDGEVFQTFTQNYGTTITVPEAPTKEGYTFSGWQNVASTVPAQDVTYEANFTINKYMLKFIADGQVVSETLVDFGSAINAPEAPAKEGHSFVNWGNVATTMPANDVTYTAQYSVNQYTVTFKIDGEVFQTFTQNYGTAITVPEAPIKEGYTFSGWSTIPSIMPANNVTITGSFSPILASGISLSESTLSFTEFNETHTLTATVSPSNATNKSVTWTSSNTAVATVDASGLVTAKSNGTATITATTTDGSNKSATCEVTVNIAVSSDNFTFNSVTLDPGEQAELVINANLSNANLTSYQFDIYLPEGINVAYDDDEEDYVYALSGRHKKDHTLSLQEHSDYGFWRFIVSSNSNKLIRSGEGELLTLTLQASPTASGTHTVQVKNIKMAEPNQTSHVLNNTSFGLTVNSVVVNATSVSLDKTTLSFTSINQTTQLTATVLPTNATNKSVTWTSSNTNVATVDASGLVAAKSKGTATITATTTDGTNLSAECNVTVLNDGGEPPSPLAAELLSAISSAEEEIAKAIVGSNYGNIKHETSIAEYQAAIDAAKLIDPNVLDEDIVDQAKNNIAAGRKVMVEDMVLPEPGKWYYIVENSEPEHASDAGIVYVNVEGNSSDICWTRNYRVSKYSNYATYMWHFIRVEDAAKPNVFYIQNMATGLYIGNQSANTYSVTTQISTEPIPFELGFDGNSNVIIVSQKENDQEVGLHADAVNMTVVGGHTDDAASKWTFREMDFDEGALIPIVAGTTQIQTLPYASEAMSAFNDGIQFFAVSKITKNIDNNGTEFATIELYKKDSFKAGEPFIIISDEDRNFLLTEQPTPDKVVDKAGTANGLVGVLCNTAVPKGRAYFASPTNATPNGAAGPTVASLKGYFDLATYSGEVSADRLLSFIIVSTDDMPDETKTYYAIHYYVDNSKTPYAIQLCEVGKNITLIDNPVKPPYYFSGWSEVPATMPANDITVTGYFSSTPVSLTDSLKLAIAEATNRLNEVVKYVKGEDGLINSDASNLSTNATSLDLAKLVNGNLSETTETWPNYPGGNAYLQVDLTGKEIKDFYLTIAPRTGNYYKADTPKGWIIEGSDDALTWNYINTEETDGDKLAVGQSYSYPAIHLGKEYKYVRFTSPVAIENRTNHIDHFALGEFQLYAATAEELESTLAEKVEALEAAIADAQAKVTNKTATSEDISNLRILVDQLKGIEILVSKISLSNNTLSFSALNTTQILTATVTPSNASNKTLTWTSSNTNVATVSSDGVVTAKGNGTATITATTTDGSNKSTTCSVTVDAPILVTGVSLSQTSLTFSALNTTQILTATVTPSNASNKTLTWTSSNTNVATVSSDGVVTAKGNGTATITATTTDGSNKSAICIVTVNISVLATSVSLDKSTLSFTSTGQASRLTATVLPANTTNKSVTWTSSNTNVATVDANGLVTAKSSGTATITATTIDGSNISATCTVTVTIPVDGISLSNTSLTFSALNTTQTLTATVSPSNAANKTLKWTSSNPSVATVSSNGVVTSKGNGTATITATTTDGSNKNATCSVIVSVSVTGVSLNKTSLTFSALNTTQTLSAIFTPSNAANKTLTWSSSNTNVATVNAWGVVTSVGNGTATITATTTDGSNKSATCFITVSLPRYTLKFVADGKVVSESSVEEGSTITAPAAPAKTGYTFVSWGNVAATMPAKDVTYTAQYKVNQYKLTYMIDGRVYKTYTLDYNSVINPEGDAEDDDYYYGWEDIPDRMPDHDVQVNAYITKVLGWAKSIDDKTAIYTLDGQKVVNPIKGNIYIINGKKVRY